MEPTTAGHVTDTLLLTIAGCLVATLFGILIAMLGWMGSKLYSKLDAIVTSQLRFASELHEKFNLLDRRVIAMEVRCRMEHEDDTH